MKELATNHDYRGHIRPYTQNVYKKNCGLLDMIVQGIVIQ